VSFGSASHAKDIGWRDESFVARKGQTFQMIKVGREGSCQIRFDRREYDLSSCPWLDGLTDHQTDIYEVTKK
jgi:hypothetical protein